MREHKLYEYKGEPLSYCRYGCGRQIFFVPTEKSVMPVDFETKETHFGHCPKYAELRKNNPPKRRRKKT